MIKKWRKQIACGEKQSTDEKYYSGMEDREWALASGRVQKPFFSQSRKNGVEGPIIGGWWVHSCPAATGNLLDTASLIRKSILVKYLRQSRRLEDVSPSKGLEALCRDLSVTCSFLWMTSKSRMILSTIGDRIHCDALFCPAFLQEHNPTAPGKRTPGNVKLWESPGTAGGLPR